MRFPSLNTNTIEHNRLKLQYELDGAKSPAERNAMGQFATPPALAHDILKQAKQYCPSDQSIRFLDPAFGTGAFFSALRSVFPENRVSAARGYEVDSHYGAPATDLWQGAGLDLRIEDFTLVSPSTAEPLFDLVISNPPYVRHHHLQSQEKNWLRVRSNAVAGIEISGLAGLYCYFIALSHQWMAPGALAGWLIPSEFMDVNYGAAIKRYLLDRVTLLHIHRFDPADVQFGDALVSSAIVWFRKERPPANHKVRMTYGGSLIEPKTERHVAARDLRSSRKWTRFPCSSSEPSVDVPTLRDFFQIKRGLVTGDNKFFILNKKEITDKNLPQHMFRPILPSPRSLVMDEVPSNDSGEPVLADGLFLLDCRIPSEQVCRDYPNLWTYLEEGRDRGVADRYICRHRTPWYAQELRPPAPFVCTYLGRSGKKNKNPPFRFILNRSHATATNVYLMLYPIEGVADAMVNDSTLQERTWAVLKSIRSDVLFNEGRVYGGGLHKLEPGELANVPSAALGELFANVVSRAKQIDLFADLPTDVRHSTN